MLKAARIIDGEGRELNRREGHDAFEPNLPAIWRHYPTAKYIEYDAWDGERWVLVVTVYKHQ